MLPKSKGWGFESLHPCQMPDVTTVHAPPNVEQAGLRWAHTEAALPCLRLSTPQGAASAPPTASIASVLIQSLQLADA